MVLQDVFEICVEKIRKNMKDIGSFDGEFPGKADGMYFDVERNELRPLKHIFCWTQSFFTGMAGLSFQATGNAEFLKWLNRFYDSYYAKVFKYPNDTMHDLGFLYTPYAVMMYKVTGDTKMRELGIKAADELIKRYVPAGHYIKSWGRMDGIVPEYVDTELAKDHFFTKSDGLVIIDSMMNMPLLYWASEETKNPIYKNIAEENVKTIIKYLVRDDYSVYHAYRFDESGKPVGGESFCGYSTNSHWARGTTWIVYGLANAYSYTGKEEYLDLAIKISQKFISLCGQDAIPEWDFRLPDSERNGKKSLDTSAAAIMVCAIQCILDFREDDGLEAYKNKALKTLCEDYFNTDASTNGMLKYVNGLGIYAGFADYYFVEALAKEIYNIPLCWTK